MLPASADDVPTWLFAIAAPTDFASIARGGSTMNHCTSFRVAGAGNVTVRLKRPRDGAATEVISCLAGETIYAKVAEITAADGGCFPILVSR